MALCCLMLLWILALCEHCLLVPIAFVSLVVQVFFFLIMQDVDDALCNLDESFSCLLLPYV